MEDGKIKSFKQLKIWQKGVEIVKDTYHLTKQFPKEELYGLTSQIKRSAISIPANVAEGFKRYHPLEYKRFLRVALGSAAELETELIIANELGFIRNSELESISEKLDHVSKMISSLVSRLS